MSCLMRYPVNHKNFVSNSYNQNSKTCHNEDIENRKVLGQKSRIVRKELLPSKV